MREVPVIDVEKMRAAIRNAKAGGMSFRKLSIQAGMAPEWARQFVNGRSESPRMDTAMGLAGALNIPLTEFYSDFVEFDQPVSDKKNVEIFLPVTLPSAAVLSEAFLAILMSVDPPVDDAGSLAKVLAEHFPAALQGALYRPGRRRAPAPQPSPAPSPQAADNR